MQRESKKESHKQEKGREVGPCKVVEAPSFVVAVCMQRSRNK